MKIPTIIKLSLVGLAIIPAILLSSNTAGAAQIPYVSGTPLPTTPTPAFNPFSNIPFGVGDESDFVRVRPSTGDPTNNGTNGERNSLYIDTLNAACNVGDMYDVRTYVHNGADDDFNNNGTGTSIARDTTLAMTAPLNTENNRFTFGSTISASNAATVTDTGKLNCNSRVKLEIVPGSVKVYSRTLGWVNATVDAVNGTIKIGSRVVGSGDVWGCWDERIQIVYTVKVVALPTPPTPLYSCDLLTNTGKISDNKYGFKVNYTATNGATLKDITYVYNDGTTVKDGATTSHTFTNTTSTTKSVTATPTFIVNGVEKTGAANAKCATEFKVDAPITTVTTTTPKVLPNTGAGGLIAAFSGVSFIGAFLYRLRALRSL